MRVVPFLVGPTAVGKTAVSIQISKYWPVEIISADSRQIYTYLDIGTAKPDSHILKTTPHHFINSLNPQEYFSAGMFGEQARKCVSKIIERNKIPFVVGGSGFYIQALVDGLSEMDKVDVSIRNELRARWDKQGSEYLYYELKQIDPLLAKNLKPADKQRILRGLEVYYMSGQKLSDQQKHKPQAADFRPCMAGITTEREYLYEQINLRVDLMIRQGLVDEVVKLIQMGYKKGINALNTVGYKEVFDYLENKLTHEEMIEEIKKNSRRYAKRQLTWFRRDDRIKWFNINDYADIEEMTNSILKYFQDSISIPINI